MHQQTDKVKRLENAYISVEAKEILSQYRFLLILRLQDYRSPKEVSRLQIDLSES